MASEQILKVPNLLNKADRKLTSLLVSDSAMFSPRETMNTFFDKNPVLDTSQQAMPLVNKRGSLAVTTQDSVIIRSRRGVSNPPGTANHIKRKFMDKHNLSIPLTVASESHRAQPK